MSDHFQINYTPCKQCGESMVHIDEGPICQCCIIEALMARIKELEEIMNKDGCICGVYMKGGDK